MRSFIPAVVTALFVIQSPVAADAPPPFPEFSAKRVGVPQNSAGKRITIQIDPALAFIQPLPSSKGDQGASTEETEVAAAAVPDRPIGNYAWFWNEIPPDLTANSAQRTTDVVELLDRIAGSSRDIAAPRAQDLRTLIDAYGTDILIKSIDTEVSPAIALAVMAVESSGRVDAVSSAGAKGLMQLMPATAERFGVRDTTASENIRGGIEYLDWLIRHFEGDTVLALAGYNAGEGAVKEHGGVPPYAETRDYIPKVLAAWRVARMLCQTPPKFLDEGCVFQGRMSPS